MILSSLVCQGFFNCSHYFMNNKNDEKLLFFIFRKGTEFKTGCSSCLSYITGKLEQIIPNVTFVTVSGCRYLDLWS